MNRFRQIALLMLLGSLALHLLLPLVCSEVQLVSTDLCWLLNATPPELERAFPKGYLLVYISMFFLEYGLLAFSVLVAIWVFLGRQLRQNLGLTTFSVAFTLVLAEVGLRIIGYQPGQFAYNQWVHPVDSVYLLEGFTTDSHGILKVDTHAYQKLWTVFANSSEELIESEPLNGTFSGELLALANDHLYDTDLRPPSNNSVIRDYQLRPVNADGFYSIPFDTVAFPDRRVLLLGDSFTWGHSSSHKSKSFANILLSRGFNVFNTGISGADVQQYEAVLKAYFPKMRPDVVVLNFFMGNDVAFFKRPVGQQYPIMYHTNAGCILSMHAGVHFSTLDSAYLNVMSNMSIPPTDPLNRWMARTVVTTYLWEFLVNAELIDHTFFVGRMYPERDFTNELMNPIFSFCDSVGVPFILSVIPKLEGDELLGAESVDGLFRNMKYSQPKMTVEMYNAKDGHFNDDGHEVYANYLQHRIDSCLQNKTTK